MARAKLRLALSILLTGSLCLTGCNKAPSTGSTADVAPADTTSAAADTSFATSDGAPASRVTSKKSEWNVGGIVGGKTQTTTIEQVPAPPVVTEPVFPRKQQPAPQSGLLTAGDVDDLLNPAQYADYAGRFLQEQGKDLPFVDTRTRVTVKVVDSRGRPVPFARAAVRRAGSPLRLVTDAAGTASFFPRFDNVPQQTSITASTSTGTATKSISSANTRLIEIILPGTASAPQAMDIALVIDTTGSMGDEMAYLSAELQEIVARVQHNVGQLDLRIGVILYRDDGDTYVVRSVPMTADINAIRNMLAQQEAGGGGDMPEAMDQAMAAATHLKWRPNAAKALLLVTDAPPHEDSLAPTLKSTEQLRESGVQIVPLAASGVDDTAQYVLRTMAAMTQGRYLFLTDDSGIGNAHAEPDVACYLVTRLDQLVARVLAGIATGQRIEPRPDDIVRTVGAYRRGRCMAPGQA